MECFSSLTSLPLTGTTTFHQLQQSYSSKPSAVVAAVAEVETAILHRLTRPAEEAAKAEGIPACGLLFLRSVVLQLLSTLELQERAEQRTPPQPLTETREEREDRPSQRATALSSLERQAATAAVVAPVLLLQALAAAVVLPQRKVAVAAVADRFHRQVVLEPTQLLQAAVAVAQPLVSLVRLEDSLEEMAESTLLCDWELALVLTLACLR